MIRPGLTDVPETMLWTLHNRAVEASRPDAALNDPDAVRIYRAIDYNYEQSFGVAEPSHAIRSAMFDDALKTFLSESPDGVVVNLGEGLETQRFRVQGNQALWLSVDLPEAMDVRERFIEPDAAHLHIRCSATDRRWFDSVPANRPVFITAQGLFMYFKEDVVRSLLVDMNDALPGVWVMFDTIPRWLSRRTMSPGGWKKTPRYTTPPMPWGINRDEVLPTLHRWVPELSSASVISWRRFPRGVVGRYVFPLVSSTPYLRRFTPLVVKLRLRNG